MRGTPASATSVVRLVFLARLREALGASHERLDLAAPTTVGALRAMLCARGGAWAVELAPGRAVRVAVHPTLFANNVRPAPGDKVELFPPVTDGDR